MTFSKEYKYVVDSHTGTLYIPVQDHIITNMPYPTSLNNYTALFLNEDDTIVAAPGTAVIDMSYHIRLLGKNLIGLGLKFDTDLPVIYERDSKMYLLSGSVEDATYDLLDEYVKVMDKDDNYIPRGEKYLDIYMMMIADYYIDDLPYEEFCQERGISYVSHVHSYIRIEPSKEEENDTDDDIDLIVIE